MKATKLIVAYQTHPSGPYVTENSESETEHLSWSALKLLKLVRKLVKRDVSIIAENHIVHSGAIARRVLQLQGPFEELLDPDLLGLSHQQLSREQKRLLATRSTIDLAIVRGLINGTEADSEYNYREFYRGMMIEDPIDRWVDRHREYFTLRRVMEVGASKADRPVLVIYGLLHNFSEVLQCFPSDTFELTEKHLYMEEIPGIAFFLGDILEEHPEVWPVVSKYIDPQHPNNVTNFRKFFFAIPREPLDCDLLEQHAAEADMNFAIEKFAYSSLEVIVQNIFNSLWPKLTYNILRAKRFSASKAVFWAEVVRLLLSLYSCGPVALVVPMLGLLASHLGFSYGGVVQASNAVFLLLQLALTLTVDSIFGGILKLLFGFCANIIGGCLANFAAFMCGFVPEKFNFFAPGHIQYILQNHPLLRPYQYGPRERLKSASFFARNEFDSISEDTMAGAIRNATRPISLSEATIGFFSCGFKRTPARINLPKLGASFLPY